MPTDRLVLGGAIRAKRRQQELTLAEIGQRSGLSIGFLSQVERGLAAPSDAALGAIAGALGVEAAYFVTAPSASALVTQVDGRDFDGVEGHVRRARLTMSFPGQALQAVLVEVPPRFEGAAASHLGEEIAYVLEGTVVCTIDGAALSLGAADSVHFRSALPHAWSNPGEAPARILWAGTDEIMPPLHEEQPLNEAAPANDQATGTPPTDGSPSGAEPPPRAGAIRYSAASAA